MASITPPDAATVRRLCGISEALTGETETAFDTRLGSFISSAEVDVALDVGEDLYDGTAWTARQAEAMAEVVGYRAGALMLRDTMVRKATGTQEPLGQEESDAIQQAIDSLEGLASERIGRITAGVQTEKGAPFTLPSFAATTFTRATDDRTPSERIALLDPRDDVAPDDLDNG